jgi:hydroxymethylpyrimidine pyrophosphatase-like HAD family hydrolase
LVLTCPDVDALQECGETVFGASGYHFAFASRHFAEVVAAGAEKGAAARLLAGRLGVPMSHTMGAGDAMTDYPMLKACALAFVPEDAPGSLLDIAAFVMPCCENGGLEQAFAHALSVMEG